MTIVPVRGIPSRTGATPPLDRTEQHNAGTGLEHLANRVSALDRLVSDAGALGKFREDQPNEMPSGTSSFTVPISQTVAHVEARLASPNERILSANQTQVPRDPVNPMQRTDASQLGASHDVVRSHVSAPRSDVKSDAENRASAFVRGNRPPSGA